MTILWITIGVALLIVWVISAFDIVPRHLGPGRTAGWLPIILILPIVGAVLYWALRKPSPEEVQAYADADREFHEQARRRPFDSTRIGP
jgi:hypothetical protein